MIYRLGTEVAGACIVLFAIHEVFSDIFHPTRSGNLSDLIGRTTSHMFRRTALRPSAGPIALIAVILSWVILLAVGFALIYSGLYPSHFLSHTGELKNSLGSRFIHCLYFSLGALSTFQTFDLDPQTPWLRLIVAIEGLIGIGMITASVSWLVLLYPALERTRQLSIRVSLLVKAEQRTQLSLIDQLGVPTLTDLSQAMIRLRLDLILFPILLHFHATEGSAAIGPSLPHAFRLCREGMSTSQPDDIRLAAAQLQIALEDLSRSIAERVLKSKDTDVMQVFEKFRDQE